jgi:hypothetical protein
LNEITSKMLPEGNTIPRAAPALITWLAVLCALGGCDSKPTRLQRDIIRVVDDYGGLRGAGDSSNAALRNEIDRIAEEGGTPRQLDESSVADDENLAMALTDLVKKRRVQSVLSYSEELLPTDWFHFDAIALEKVREFLQLHEPALVQIDEALARPRCDFHLQHAAGYFADSHRVEYAVISARLKAFDAAVRIDDDGPDAAMGPLQAMFRLAACLGREKQVTCRLYAARMRHEALLVLAAIVADERTSQRTVGEVFALLREHLDGWTPDADTWIGDRALGMHLYEVVRDGHILDVLTDEEHDQLMDNSTRDEFIAAAQSQVDSDELFYLQTMRKVIAACERPSYQRGDVFAETQKALDELEAVGEYPLVAGRMLLINIQRTQETQAADRAMCEAWALVLAHSLGVTPPPYSINPFSGIPYRLEREDGFVYLYAGMQAAEGDVDAGDEQPITVREFRR